MGVVPFALPVPNSYMSWIGVMVSTVFLFKRREFLNLMDCLSHSVSRQPGRLLPMVVSTKELKPQVPLWMPSFRFPFFSISADYLESTILRTRCMHGWQKIGAISQAFAPIVSVLVNLVASDFSLKKGTYWQRVRWRDCWQSRRKCSGSGTAKQADCTGSTPFQVPPSR